MHNVTSLDLIFRERAEGEPDMVFLAAESMRKAGIDEAQVQIFLSEPVLASCRDLSPAVQQHRLNAYVNGQYLSLDVDTSQERDLLRTTVAPAEWLRIFDMYHAVKLKALGLPRAW